PCGETRLSAADPGGRHPAFCALLLRAAEPLPAHRRVGGGRWIRTTEGVSQQIYSLPPLAAWVSLRETFLLRGQPAFRLAVQQRTGIFVGGSPTVNTDLCFVAQSGSGTTSHEGVSRCHPQDECGLATCNPQGERSPGRHEHFRNISCTSFEGTIRCRACMTAPTSAPTRRDPWLDN